MTYLHDLPIYIPFGQSRHVLLLFNPLMMHVLMKLALAVMFIVFCASLSTRGYKYYLA